MEARFIRTNDSADPIFLALAEIDGNAHSTAVSLNHKIIATPDGDCNSLLLGTNKGLKGNAIFVTTNVLKSTPSPISRVEYTLSGSVGDDGTDRSEKTFTSDQPAVSHGISYFFV